MKKTVIFLLTLTLLLLSPISSFAVGANAGTVDPAYQIDIGVDVSLTISEGRAKVDIIYDFSSEPVSNVKITVSMIRKVSLFVYIVELDNGGISYEYTSSQLSGTVTVGADASASGTYIATARIEVTNANGSVTTDTLSATQTKS